MAQVRQNIIIQGLSGSLGDQLVIKHDKRGRTIVGVMPAFNPDRQFTAAQLEAQQAFREAAAYAKAAQAQEVYIDKAAGTIKSPFNLALADYLNEPQILDVDVNDWNGQVGQVIRVKAFDDVQVTQVYIMIMDDQDAMLERGYAQQKDGLWWEYVTTVAATGTPRVIATIQDLPGHSAQMTKDM